MPKGVHWIIAGFVIAIFGVVFCALSVIMMTHSALDWGTSWDINNDSSEGWNIVMMNSFILMGLGGLLFLIGLIVLVLNA